MFYKSDICHLFPEGLVLLQKYLYICSVKTPGGKLVYHYTKKLGAIPKCGDCKIKLHGVSSNLVMFVLSYFNSRCIALILLLHARRDVRSKTTLFHYKILVDKRRTDLETDNNCWDLMQVIGHEWIRQLWRENFNVELDSWIEDGACYTRKQFEYSFKHDVFYSFFMCSIHFLIKLAVRCICLCVYHGEKFIS